MGIHAWMSLAWQNTTPLDWVVAVSYTHLDVYKRQQDFLAMRIDKNSRSFIAVQKAVDRGDLAGGREDLHDAVLVGGRDNQSVPVSYTHLDVYKRQVVHVLQ